MVNVVKKIIRFLLLSSLMIFFNPVYANFDINKIVGAWYRSSESSIEFLVFEKPFDFPEGLEIEVTVENKYNFFLDHNYKYGKYLIISGKNANIAENPVIQCGLWFYAPGKNDGKMLKAFIKYRSMCRNAHVKTLLRAFKVLSRGSRYPTWVYKDISITEHSLQFKFYYPVRSKYLDIEWGKYPPDTTSFIFPGTYRYSSE